MLLNYVKNYIKYNPKRGNPENDSSKKIEKTRNCIRICMAISSITLFFSVLFLIKYLIGEKPLPRIVVVLFFGGLIFTGVFAKKYWCKVLNHDCGKNTHERILIYGLIFDDVSILLIASLIALFVGIISLIFDWWDRVISFAIFLLGLVLFIISYLLYKKNDEKYTRSKTDKEAIDQVVYSLCESKITTEDQFKVLRELLKFELQRCYDARNAIESNIGLIISGMLGLSILSVVGDMPLLDAIIIICIDLDISALFLIYYIRKRSKSSYCKCSTNIVYDSLCDLELFMCDPQKIEKIRIQMALLDSEKSESENKEDTNKKDTEKDESKDDKKQIAVHGYPFNDEKPKKWLDSKLHAIYNSEFLKNICNSLSQSISKHVKEDSLNWGLIIIFILTATVIFPLFMKDILEAWNPIIDYTKNSIIILFAIFSIFATARIKRRYQIVGVSVILMVTIPMVAIIYPFSGDDRIKVFFDSFNGVITILSAMMAFLTIYDYHILKESEVYITKKKYNDTEFGEFKNNLGEYLTNKEKSENNSD